MASTSSSNQGWVDIVVVDAFSTTSFGGNPAGVVLLNQDGCQVELSDAQKLIIARQMNLSETAFVTSQPSATDDALRLQWFTPFAEERLCGHATVGATAALVFAHGAQGAKQVEGRTYAYDTLSGRLGGRVVAVGEDGESATIELDFPADEPQELVEGDKLRADIVAAFEASLMNVAKARQPELVKVYKGRFDAIIEVKMPPKGQHLGDVAFAPSAFHEIGVRGTAITTALFSSSPSAPGRPAPSFHSRFFAPDLGISEDPVTGSLHCSLATLWHTKLGAHDGQEIRATQGGPRRGEIGVVWKREDGRVLLRGEAVKSERDVPPASFARFADRTYRSIARQDPHPKRIKAR